MESADTGINVKEESADLAIQGPMTCSQTKQLKKANILMLQMFDQDFTFEPTRKTKLKFNHQNFLLKKDF